MIFVNTQAIILQEEFVWCPFRATCLYHRPGGGLDTTTGGIIVTCHNATMRQRWQESNHSKAKEGLATGAALDL